MAVVMTTLLLLTQASSSARQCGLHALHDCLLSLRLPARLSVLANDLPREGVDLSLAEIEAEASRYGCVTLIVRWMGEPVFANASPAIIPVIVNDDEHFITILDSANDNVLVADFPARPGWIPMSALRSAYGWDGYALHIARTSADLQPVSEAVSAERIRRVVWWVVVGVVSYATFFYMRQWFSWSKRRNIDRTPDSDIDRVTPDDVPASGGPAVA